MRGFAGICGRIEVVLSVDDSPPSKSKLAAERECGTEKPSGVEDDPTAQDLSGLKQSIVHHIIDFLQDDNAALKTCSLIGRSWISRSRQHLFRRLCLFEEDFDEQPLSGSRQTTAFLIPYRSYVISLTFSSGKRGQKGRWPGSVGLDPRVLESMLKCFTNLRHLTLVQCHIEPWSEGAPLWDYRFAYHTLKTLSVVPARHYAQADVLNTLFFFRAVTIIKLELLDDNKEYNSPAPTGPVPPTHRAVAPARAALREMRVHTLYVNDRARPWGEEVVHRMCVAGACKALQLDHWGFSHAAAAGADRWAATLPALTGLVLSIGPPGYYKQGVPGMQKCEEHWYTALAGCSALRELRLVVRAYELGLPHVGTGLHYALSEVPAHLTRLVLQLDFGPSRKRGSVPTAVSVVRLFELLEEVPLQRFLQRFADLKTLDVVLASDREGDTASWCTEELCEQTWDVIFEKLPGIVKTPGMLHCTIRAD